MFGNNKSGDSHRSGGGVHTTNDGPVWCRVCGRKVRSKLGEVCSRNQCQATYLARYEGADSAAGRR